jgi:hypothetical protein
VWVELSDSGQGPVADSSEHGNEASSSIKAGEFFGKLNVLLFKETSATHNKCNALPLHQPVRRILLTVLTKEENIASKWQESNERGDLYLEAVSKPHTPGLRFWSSNSELFQPP